MSNKVVKKCIFIGLLCCMAISCGEGKSYDYEDFQEGIKKKTVHHYSWALLPFCHYNDYIYSYYVVTLRNGSVVDDIDIDRGNDWVNVIMAAADAKDFKIADFFFAKLKARAVSKICGNDDISRYQSCLSVYLMCKVTTLLEEGSIEAKDQIVLFLNNYEVVHLTDANYINNICDNVLARSIRVGDRALAERIIRCYRQDAVVKVDKQGRKVYKPGSYDDYEYVFSWKSKEDAKKALAEAIKNGDL